jgi:hypothetical protein
MRTLLRLTAGLALAIGLAGSVPSQSPIMKNSTPSPDGKAGASKSELNVEDAEPASTPPTLRIVFALLLIAGTVAVVVVPSRKGGGDSR